jgi:DNA transformation protein and related proteins
MKNIVRMFTNNIIYSLAFLRLQTLDPGACLDLLYGLEGAIQGIKWNKLPLEKKQVLVQFHKMANKK